MKPDEARRLALSLPEATEQDHHGFPSFRVRGKIFATFPDQDRFRVMLDPEETQTAVTANPAAFEELWWGQRLAGVEVRLRKASRGQLLDLLEAAWQRKAPKKLARELEERDR